MASHSEFGADVILGLDRVKHGLVLTKRNTEPTGLLYRLHDESVIFELVHESLVVLRELAVVGSGDEHIVKLVHEGSIKRTVADTDSFP